MNGDLSLKIFDSADVLDMVMIGQGAYRKIYRGIYQSEPVVVKILEDVDIEDICQEAKFLDRLKQLNIVEFRCICLQERSIMFEYMVFILRPYGVNVEVHNQAEVTKILSRPICHGYQNLIVEAAERILDEVSYFHSKGVAHRYLKSSNLLVSDKVIDNSKNIVIKYCDFGESWANIVQATNCKKAHTTNVFKGILIKFAPHKIEDTSIEIRSPYLFHDGGSYHIETSPLICCAN